MIKKFILIIIKNLYKRLIGTSFIWLFSLAFIAICVNALTYKLRLKEFDQFFELSLDLLIISSVFIIRETIINALEENSNEYEED